MAHIRPEHVRVKGGRVHVDIPGKNARTVQVHVDVAAKLAELMKSVATPYVMGNFDPSHRDPVGLHKSHSVMPTWAPSSMNAARLRTTWLVKLLNSNARLSEIAVAAGVKQLYAIEALLPYVEVRDDANAYLAGEK